MPVHLEAAQEKKVAANALFAIISCSTRIMVNKALLHLHLIQAKDRADTLAQPPQ